MTDDSEFGLLDSMQPTLIEQDIFPILAVFFNVSTVFSRQQKIVRRAQERDKKKLVLRIPKTRKNSQTAMHR